MNVKCYKPMYLGFSVLELSKWKMYNFHYSYMKPKYNNRIHLNYMDTDSFIYTIKTEDFYKDISNDLISRFDTSDYDPKNKFNLPLVNKKILGMMKDENCGIIMKEFVGLRAKMYSIRNDNNGEIKKSKGVKKMALDRVTLSDYKKCLYSKNVYSDSMYTFRTYRHQIYTQKIEKIVLSYNDDKRYIKFDGIQTYAWGHYKLRENDFELHDIADYLVEETVEENVLNNWDNDGNDEMFLGIEENANNKVEFSDCDEDMLMEIDISNEL